jgi:hypothetical protein
LGFVVFNFFSFAVVRGGGPPPMGLPVSFLIIFPLHALTMLASMGLLVVYVLHALQNNKLDQNTKHMWAILLFVGNFIAMPIYFYKCILPLQDDAG